MMRVIVCGGRNFSDRTKVAMVLGGLRQNHSDLIIICGYDPDDPRFQGADQLAYEWARAARIPVMTHPAAWHRFGRSAGPRRNARMQRDALPTNGVAFEGGDGTVDMVRKLHAVGIPVDLIGWELGS